TPEPHPARRARRRSGGSVRGGCLRGGSSASRSAVAAATRRTARSNASSVLAEVDVTPLTFRTYWRAPASISSGVAGGSRPRSVVMLRHIPLGLPRRGGDGAGAGRRGGPAWTAGRSTLPRIVEMTLLFVPFRRPTSVLRSWRT